MTEASSNRKCVTSGENQCRQASDSTHSFLPASVALVEAPDNVEARGQVLAAQQQIQNAARGEALGAKGRRRGVRKGSSARQAEGGCKAPGAPPADRGGRGRRVDFRAWPSRQRKCSDWALGEGTDSPGNCE